MDRLERSKLKHDKFVEQVGHSVEYAAEHRKQLIKWGSIGAAALVVIAGTYLYVSHARTVRQDDLREAMRLQQANVGANEQSNPFVASFASQAEKDKAVENAMQKVANEYPGKREGMIARFYLGAMYSDAGKLAEAEKAWKQVADEGDKDYASQARFSLAQLYEATGRQAEAEKLLRGLIDNPTMLVSKEQAQIALGRMLSKTNPAEARKLLEPLRTERTAVSRVALTALSEVPRQ